MPDKAVTPLLFGTFSTTSQRKAEALDRRCVRSTSQSSITNKIFARYASTFSMLGPTSVLKGKLTVSIGLHTKV